VTFQEFRESLNPPNVYEDFENIVTPESNTCNWIYDQEEYKSWKESPKSCTFHLMGKMGCGKSVLTKSVQKKLTEDTSLDSKSSDDTMVLFYFCSRVQRPNEGTALMLASLISQLLNKSPATFQAIAGDTELLGIFTNSGRAVSLSLRFLWKILCVLLRAIKVPSIYCFIDALDECDNDSTTTFLSLFKAASTGEVFKKKSVKFFISSRENSEILDGLHKHQVVPVHSVRILPIHVTPDIELVLDTDLEDISENLCLDLTEKLTLRTTIAEKADGMFQWVNIALGVLKSADGSTFQQLLKMVEELPPQLAALYNHCLNTLQSTLSDADIDKMRHILIWILIGERPFTVEEISIALAIGLDNISLPPRSQWPRGVGRFVLKILGPFVQLVRSQSDPTDNTSLIDLRKDPGALIRLVHPSAQEFLLDACVSKRELVASPKLHIDKKKGHELLARTCIIYLQSHKFEALDIVSTKVLKSGKLWVDDKYRAILKSMIEEDAFLVYASRNWMFHTSMCEDRGTNDIFSLACDWLTNEIYVHPRRCTRQIVQYLDWPERDWWFSLEPALHVAALWASIPLTKRLLSDKDINIDGTDLSGVSVLMEACLSSSPGFDEPERLEVFQILLAKGADPHLKARSGSTAIDFAVRYGHLGIIKTLVDVGCSLAARIDIQSQDDSLIEPSIAASCEINITDSWRTWSYAHWAAFQGRADILRFLFTQGASAKATGLIKETPLHLAAEKGSVECCSLLVSKGATVDATDAFGRAPLSFAVSEQRYDTVKCLLKMGATIDMKDFDGASHLHSAVLSKDLKLVRIFLDAGISPNLKDLDGRTCLHLAPQVDAAILRSLVANGGDLCILDGREWDTLRYAVVVDELATIEFILNQTTPDRLDNPDTRGQTVLHIAASQGNTKVISMLVDQGAHSVVDMNGHTPVEIAKRCNMLDRIPPCLLSETILSDALRPDFGAMKWHRLDTANEIDLSDESSVAELTGEAFPASNCS
jgi:ankyrin repeat protein